jgi:hypothetical protein
MPPPLGPPLGPRAPAVLGPGAAPSAGPVRVDAAQTPRPATSNPPETDRAADAPLGAGLARAARPQDAQPGARLRALDAADTSDFRTIKHVAAATRVTPTSALFRLGGPDGLRLRPGEQVLLELPPDLASRPIYQAILEHRQVEAEKSAPLGGEKKRWDPTPGLTALHFHATAPSEAEGWRYWHAPWGASGPQGAKYAELRGEDWEAESHFDLAKHGTVHVDEGDLVHAPIVADALRLRGLGKDPTFVKQVLVTFAPPPPAHVDTHVFTPGTTFGDLLTAEGQAFGKDYEKGTFPGALTLFPGSDGGVGHAKLPKGAHYAAGVVRLPLEVGRTLSGVELAVGDTKPDGVLNSDGAIGSQGHSKLDVGVLRAGADAPEWFVEGHGVPPQGVIFIGPSRSFVVAPGDQLVLSARVDPTYLMGYRLSYAS